MLVKIDILLFRMLWGGIGVLWCRFPFQNASKMIVEKGNIFSQLQKKFGSDIHLYKEILVEQMFCTPFFS